jgi:hypothetical protein
MEEDEKDDGWGRADAAPTRTDTERNDLAHILLDLTATAR